MASPAQRNITIRRGDTWREHFAFVAPGGRVLDDLVITASSTSISSEDGFLSSDDGEVLTVVDGTGVDDGTTMLVSSTTTGSLSNVATASRTGVVATIGAADLSAYTDHLAEFRDSRDAATSVTITVDSTRADVGVFLLSIDDSLTADMDTNGVWDWQCQGPNGTVTLFEGRVTIVKDVARP